MGSLALPIFICACIFPLPTSRLSPGIGSHRGLGPAIGKQCKIHLRMNIRALQDVDMILVKSPNSDGLPLCIESELALERDHPIAAVTTETRCIAIADQHGVLHPRRQGKYEKILQEGTIGHKISPGGHHDARKIEPELHIGDAPKRTGNGDEVACVVTTVRARTFGQKLADHQSAHTVRHKVHLAETVAVSQLSQQAYKAVTQRRKSIPLG